MTGFVLAATREQVLHEMSRFFVQPEHRSFDGLILMIAAAVMIGSGYWVWRWQQRLSHQVSGRSLLNQLGSSIGLSRPQRRLLWKMGRAAELEPAMALISPQLLTQLIRRSEIAGMSLTGKQTACVGKILDLVASSADKQGVAATEQRP